MNVMMVFEQVLVMFALMALGYLAVKLKILAKETTRDLTVFIISFVIPAVIISAFLKPMERDGIGDLVWSFGLNILYFLVIILLNPRLFSSRLVSDPVRRMQMRYAFTFSNNGFMGLPILLAVFGTTGGFYAGVQVAIANGFMWSYGLGLFRQASGEKASLLKVISHPNIVALAVGLTLYFTQLPLPKLLVTTLGYVKDLNTPLSMVVVGSSIAMINFRGSFREKSLWVMSLLRNLGVPLVLLGFFVLFGQFIDFSPVAASVIIVMSGCPVAAMVTMVSKLYGFDETYPTELISLSTLMSLVTLPLIIILCTLVLF